MKIFQYPSVEAEQKLKSIINRGVGFSDDDIKRVSEIISHVRSSGDQALVELTNRFDAPDMIVRDIMASQEEMDVAEKLVAPEFLATLDRAISQIREFHQKQVRNSWINTPRDGVMLGQLMNPVEAAGMYVPGARGGMTPLVSSVLMGGIPAKIAGVDHVAMATPPTNEGKVNPHLLVAAKRVGVDVVYKVGSAWAIAALAYGTESVRKVDVIVGPGNIYVTIAKKLLAGTVGIDMIAGPSEILVIADGTANPKYIAADMISQAEHDSLASAVLITDSDNVAKAVSVQIEEQLANLERNEIASKSIDTYGAILRVDNLDEAVALTNRIAPEHLELQVQSPFSLISRIRNAGALFIGEYSPEPVGDYFAGTNHVLPTGGTARFSSALSVDHFIKQTSLIYYSRDAFHREANDIIRLAKVEALTGHARSVRVRQKTGDT